MSCNMWLKSSGYGKKNMAAVECIGPCQELYRINRQVPSGGAMLQTATGFYRVMVLCYRALHRTCVGPCS